MDAAQSLVRELRGAEGGGHLGSLLRRDLLGSVVIVVSGGSDGCASGRGSCGACGLADLRQDGGFLCGESGFLCGSGLLLFLFRLFLLRLGFHVLGELLDVFGFDIRDARAGQAGGGGQLTAGVEAGVQALGADADAGAGLAEIQLDAGQDGNAFPKTKTHGINSPNIVFLLTSAIRLYAAEENVKNPA